MAPADRPGVRRCPHRDPLESIPVGAVGWGQFRDEHPDARVLSRSTGHDRDYLTNPYVGYDDPDSEPLFALPGDPDPRLPVKARVVGVGAGKDAVAVSRDLLADRGVQHVDVGRDRVVLWHAPGQVSALDTREIPDGAEIGSVAAFAAEVGGTALDFTRADDGTFRDTADRNGVEPLRTRRERTARRRAAHRSGAPRHVLVRLGRLPAGHEARARGLNGPRGPHLSASASSTSEADSTLGAAKYDG